MALVYTKLNIKKKLQNTVKKAKLKSHSQLCQSCFLSWQNITNLFECLYRLESKVGYMAVKPTEREVCLVSSFDAGFLAKSNIDAA